MRSDLKEFSVRNVSVSVDVVDPEREPELPVDLLIPDGGELGQAENEFWNLEEPFFYSRHFYRQMI